MGDPSAFLVRSNSQPSPTSSEEKKGNSIKRALTSSISFGRFVSESLDWERFSAFNQNRYLEEVERYSKPGSVAEKKAYFEAHYKRKRAAALLEQKNVEPNNVPETNVTRKVEYNSCFESESTQREISADSEKTKQEEVMNCDTVVSVSCEAEIVRELGDGLSERDDQANEPMVVVENTAQLINHLEKDECVVDLCTEESKKCKDASSMRISAPSNEEKPEASSSNLLQKVSSTKQAPLPPVPPLVKPRTPGQLVNKEKMTLNSINNANDYSNKKTRSTPTSLHMSINFPSCFVETPKAMLPVLPQKNVNSRLVRTPLKKPKNTSLPRILTRASINGICNTSSENRTVRPHGNSIPGSRMADGKMRSPSTSYSKSSNTLASNGRSLMVSSSFTFKSEERAAKRKEFFQKLEQKLKSNEPDKQPHAKPQVKARNDLKDHLKVPKYTDISSRVDSSSTFTKKSLNAISFLPKIKERIPFRVQDNDPRPPWRFSTKMDSSTDVTGKNNRPPIYSTKSFSKKSVCENSSPNVQVCSHL